MDASAFAEWRSHKVVRAAEIVSIEDNESYDPAADADGLLAVRMMAVAIGNGEIRAVSVPSLVFARGIPKPQDFLVVYDDGYVSWSPRKAFLEGYDRISADPVDRRPLEQILAQPDDGA